MPMLSPDAISKHLAYDQPINPELAHVMIALRGRAKGERKAEACHLIPIVAVTRSGLKPSFGWKEPLKRVVEWELRTVGCSETREELLVGRKSLSLGFSCLFKKSSRSNLSLGETSPKN